MILPNRTDALLVDLVITSNTTITNENRSSNFLIKHEAHLALDPRNNIELGDIEDIIAIKLLLLVNGLRASGTTGNTEELFLLQTTLDVTLCTSIISSNVGITGTNTSERIVLSTIQNRANPLSIPLKPIRSRSINVLSLREKNIDILNAVLTSMSENCVLKGTSLLCIIENRLHLVVRKNLVLLVSGPIKNILTHLIVSFLALSNLFVFITK